MSLYQVESIAGRRRNKETEYKVKWKGFSESQSTWEPAHNLKFVRDMIAEYERKNKRGRRAKVEVLDDSLENSSELIGESDFDKQSQQVVVSNSKENRSQANKRKKSRGRPNKLKTKQIERVDKRGRLNSSQNKEESEISAQKQNRNKMGSDDGQSVEQVERVKGQKSVEQIQDVPGEQNEQEQLSEVIDINSDEDVDDSLVVLELARRGQRYWYLVRDGEDVRWMSRTQLMRSHSVALINFYEQKIRFVPKLEGAIDK